MILFVGRGGASVKVRDYYTRVLQRSIGAWRRRPFPGPFALSILEALRDEVVLDREGTPVLRVHVDKQERGDHPFREEFSVLFRLAEAPPLWHPKSVEVSDKPIGVTETIDTRNYPKGVPIRETYYVFTFRKPWGVPGSLKRFRAFVRSRLAVDVSAAFGVEAAELRG